MPRKIGCLLFFLVFIFSISGCTIVKGTGGAAVGMGQGACVGAKEGFKDDVSFIQKADAWVKKNLW